MDAFFDLEPEHEAPKVSVKPTVYVTEITLSDKSKIKFEPNEIVVVVGPNNAGKSAFLRGIRDKLTDSRKTNTVVKSITVTKAGTTQDFLAWLEQWASKDLGANPNDLSFHGLGVKVNISRIHIDWPSQDNTLGIITRWLCNYVSGSERLELCKPPQTVSLTKDHPVHPIHYLQRDDRLEERISKQVELAFGAQLTLHRGDGKLLPLYIGDRPTLQQGEDRVSASYLKRLEELPELIEQGDGMKSYAGLLLATMTSQESIMLIDEPEAFLHPPQARLLASTIASELKDRQVFLATHSSDILRGALDSSKSNAKILRIERKGDVNKATILDVRGIETLWKDPLLRHSNIFDGLFHENVIVCESDSDCRFFSAMVDALFVSSKLGSKRPDIFFTHCGGKHRIPVVVGALRALNVNVSAIVDFDVFAEEDNLKSIYETSGGDWNTIVSSWRQVYHAVNSKKPELEKHDFELEFAKLIKANTESSISVGTRKELTKVLKKTSAWSIAKTTGVSYIPNGQPTTECSILMESLKGVNVHVIPDGELECLDRSVGSHGSHWVNEVLKKDLVADKDLKRAREFVQSVFSTL